MTITDEDATVVLTEQQTEWIDGLADAVGFFRSHPHLIPKYNSVSLMDYTPLDAEGEKERARQWVRALGSVDKVMSESLVTFTSKPGRFGPHAVGYVTARSSVCERVVTTVEREVVERDPETVERALADIPMVPRTVTEEVVSWDCGSLLGGDAA